MGSKRSGTVGLGWHVAVFTTLCSIRGLMAYERTGGKMPFAGIFLPPAGFDKGSGLEINLCDILTQCGTVLAR